MQFEPVNDPPTGRVPYGLVADEGVQTLITGISVEDVDSTNLQVKVGLD